jgi:hypothetical protein
MNSRRYGSASGGLGLREETWNVQSLWSMSRAGRMDGQLRKGCGKLPVNPSVCPNRNAVPSAAAWRSSPARSTPQPQCSARCGCSSPPSRLGVPGSGRWQPAPGAHSLRKISTGPGFLVLKSRCIAPQFVLDWNGVLPRNRCERLIARNASGNACLYGRFRHGTKATMLPGQFTAH